MQLLSRAVSHRQSAVASWQPIYRSNNLPITTAKIRLIKFSMNYPIHHSPNHNAGMWLPTFGNRTQQKNLSRMEGNSTPRIAQPVTARTARVMESSQMTLLRLENRPCKRWQVRKIG